MKKKSPPRLSPGDVERILDETFNELWVKTPPTKSIASGWNNALVAYRRRVVGKLPVDVTEMAHTSDEPKVTGSTQEPSQKDT